MDPVITKAVIEEMLEDYNAIFRGMAFVKDEYARTRASNGLMVEMCKMKDYVKTVKEKTGAPAPTPQKDHDVATSSPQKGPSTAPPVPEVAPAKPVEAPKGTEPGQQKLAEPPESIPSPGTKPTASGEPLATEKQVEAIRRFCMTPKLKGVVAETLRTKKKGYAGELSISEASDLIAKLYGMKGHIPPGAKVEGTVKT